MFLYVVSGAFGVFDRLTGRIRPVWPASALPQAADDPQVQQGMLGGSNVLPIIEMARMIDVHRTYDGVKKFVEREDDRLKKMVRDLARVA